VLDLGCGYGLLGITYALVKPKARVTLSDINSRAVKITRLNVKKLGLKNCDVIRSNLFENINKVFDNIITNPPVSAGLKTCYAMIEDAHAHLRPGGLLQLVSKHNIAGRRLSEKMKEVFNNVKVIKKKGGYRVYVSEKTID